jgi:hypothetical protein
MSGERSFDPPLIMGADLTAEGATRETIMLGGELVTVRTFIEKQDAVRRAPAMTKITGLIEEGEQVDPELQKILDAISKRNQLAS